MKTAILVPGRPDKDEYYNPHTFSFSDTFWFPWLKKQLQVRDIQAVAIEPPRPWQPRYELWKKEFERFDIREDTILVGHSAGAGFIVRWLSENKDKRVGKVILVAPWLNPEDNPVSDTADFFHFQIDPEIAARTKGITVFNSDDDQETVQKSVAMLREQAANIDYRGFSGNGHFWDERTREFPELLECILSEG